MALVGLLGALTVVAVVTLWLLVKAGTWAIQADVNDVETDAPAVVLQNGVSIAKMIVAVAFLAEVWPGLATWAYDAWHWILWNLV